MDSVSFDVTGGFAEAIAGLGETIEVRLAENPSTGFRWEPVDLGAAVIRGDSFRSSTGAGVGAGGERVFSLETGPGSYIVRFVLRRAWEDVAPRAEARLRIEVR